MVQLGGERRGLCTAGGSWEVWLHPAGPQPFGEPSQATHSPRDSSVQCITVLPPKRSVSFLETLKTQPNKTTMPPMKMQNKTKTTATQQPVVKNHGTKNI